MEKELKQNKKETLEEAAENYAKGWGEYDDKKAFITGAKWQKEQNKNLYSEEDLREAFRQGEQNISYSETYGLDSKLTEQEWFEQFKKK